MQDQVWIYTDWHGQYRWQRLSADGRKLSQSSAAFDSHTETRDSALRCNAQPFELIQSPHEPVTDTAHEVILDRQEPRD